MVPEVINVLLVEDDEDDAGLVRELLRDVPSPVVNLTHVSSLAQGLSALDRGGYDAVLLDLSLPDCDGVEGCCGVLAQHPRMPVVVLTGWPEAELGLEVLKTGAQDYLVKGEMDAGQIVRAMRFAIQRHRERTLCVARGDLGGADANIGDTVVSTQPRGMLRVEGYRLIKAVGQGTSSIVFLAEDETKRDDMQYAVKVLRPPEIRIAAARELVDRFIREAELMSRLRHPNIVRVMDYGRQSEGAPAFMAMEYVQGHSLKHYVGDRAGLSHLDKLHLVAQLARALGEIHAEGICHRDIKPENSLVTSDLRVKLTDFGIAKLPMSNMTLTSEIMGTPAYMAPEAFLSADVDHRADIFSLGVLAYELFVGQLPFPGATMPVLSEQICKQLPVEPRKLASDLPIGIQSILGRMLKKRPESRYGSVVELIADIEAVAEAGSLRQHAFGMGSLSDIFKRDWL